MSRKIQNNNNKNKKIIFDSNYAKGTKENPMIVSVGMESSKNRTLTVTLSKAVLAHLKREIKKGDKIAQWADPDTCTISLSCLSGNQPRQ